jgi:hypothetical protein
MNTEALSWERAMLRLVSLSLLRKHPFPGIQATLSKTWSTKANIVLNLSLPFLGRFTLGAEGLFRYSSEYLRAVVLLSHSSFLFPKSSHKPKVEGTLLMKVKEPKSVAALGISP